MDWCLGVWKCCRRVWWLELPATQARCEHWGLACAQLTGAGCPQVGRGAARSWWLADRWGGMCTLLRPLPGPLLEAWGFCHCFDWCLGVKE